MKAIDLVLGDAECLPLVPKHSGRVGVDPVHFPFAGFGLIFPVSSSNALCVVVEPRGRSLDRGMEPECRSQGGKGEWDC